MYHYVLLTAVLSASLLQAKPVDRRFIDLDHNGIPDWCNYQSTYAECIENGQWTSVPLTSTTTATIAAVSPFKAVPTTSVVSTLVPVTSSKATVVSTAVVTTSAVHTTSTTATPATSASSTAANQPSGTLPSPSIFNTQNGSAWSIQYVGDIGFTDQMQQKGLVGDKCRSSTLGDKVIWNCGDMECSNSAGQGDWQVCGFNMGPAFYGTDSVMTIDTDGVTNVANNNFLGPWSGDPTPQAPQNSWGMDTSNVAAINDTHGVAYAWEIWRGASDGSAVDRGNAVAAITLGQTMPTATRIGPLLTGPDKIGLGLNGIMNAEGYIYIYSYGGPSKLMVSRVKADDSVFDATQYQTLSYSSQSWISGIPEKTDNTYGMESSDNQFSCATYGSAFYSNYFNKYVIICNIYMAATNMYVSDTPYGPFTGPYMLLSGINGYGSMAHPEYSPGGSHKELYFSLGPNSKFHMYKVNFA